MTQENKNLILAISLSMLVVFAWQYFYAWPQMEKARIAQMQTQAVQSVGSGAPPKSGVPGAAPDTGAAPIVLLQTRAAALADSPRIAIDTPTLSGSIALKGARIDDLSLKGYHETIDPKSPQIILLSPATAPGGYFADFGYVPQAGSNLALPGPDSLWTADGDKLSVEHPLTLSLDAGNGLTFKRVILVDAQYMFSITDSIANAGSAPAAFFARSKVERIGRPHLSGYAVLHEGLLGVIGEARVQEWTYDAIEKEAGATKALKGEGGWIGFTDKYWATAVIPDQKATFNGVFSAAGAGTKTYRTEALGELTTIAPGATAIVKTQLFAGAKEKVLIDQYRDSLGIKNFNLMIDWGWFWFITQPMFDLLTLIHKVVGNFGVAILLITVVFKGLFFPLANKSYMSMAKMKALQPKQEEIKAKYPDDKQKQQQEIMELYKREKVNPVAGCWPMLIQIPVFFSLYKVLFITIEMRHAPFFGWIKDLSAQDPTNVFNLFGLLPYDPTHLPVIGSYLALGIWPLVMGVSMFIQMKMNPEPADPVQKQMFTYMPIVFTFMLGTFPAGLVIYWTWNNLLSVLQQGLIMKKAGVKIELWDNLKGLFAKKQAA